MIFGSWLSPEWVIFPRSVAGFGTVESTPETDVLMNSHLRGFRAKSGHRIVCHAASCCAIHSVGLLFKAIHGARDIAFRVFGGDKEPQPAGVDRYARREDRRRHDAPLKQPLFQFSQFERAADDDWYHPKSTRVTGVKAFGAAPREK